MSEAPEFMSGVFEHKMDEKCRVSVPVDWRPGPDGRLWLLQSMSYDQPMVAVLPEAEYIGRLEMIDEAAEVSSLHKLRLKGMLHARTRQTRVDEQGRLLVPRDMSEAAGLPAGGTVMLVGRGTYFEIWNPGNYAAAEERADEELSDLYDQLGVF